MSRLLSDRWDVIAAPLSAWIWIGVGELFGLDNQYDLFAFAKVMSVFAVGSIGTAIMLYHWRKLRHG